MSLRQLHIINTALIALCVAMIAFGSWLAYTDFKRSRKCDVAGGMWQNRVCLRVQRIPID